MPLQIIRNDITKVKADAIVNATNELLIPGGLGVDAAIHAAAGPRLADALKKLGSCPEGEAVTTESFNITCCKFIIHTPTPVYIDGKKETAALRCCYRSVLKSAMELNCNSVAIPILSAGSMGVPVSEAYTIATSAIREYLLECDSDLLVYLVVFSKDAVIITNKLHDQVEHYIDDVYVCEEKMRLQEQSCSYNPDVIRRPRMPECRYSLPSSEVGAPCNAENPRRAEKLKRKESSICAAAPEQEYHLGAEKLCFETAKPDSYSDQDLSFGDMCVWWMQTKNIDVGTFYCDANITRATFHNVKAHPGSVPKKTTALACVIGLKLNIGEAQDLLMRGGLALSPYNKTDVVVRFFIENQNYNIDDINATLYEEDLALLGSNAG